MGKEARAISSEEIACGDEDVVLGEAALEGRGGTVAVGKQAALSKDLLKPR